MYKYVCKLDYLDYNSLGIVGPKTIDLYLCTALVHAAPLPTDSHGDLQRCRIEPICITPEEGDWTGSTLSKGINNIHNWIQRKNSHNNAYHM